MSRFDRLELRPLKARDTRSPLPAFDPERDDKYYCEMAMKSLRRGDPEIALRYYSRALGMTPTNAAAWLGQLRCLLYFGEYNEVCLWADRALTTVPDHPEILAAKAVALGRKGETDKAIAPTCRSNRNRRVIGSSGGRGATCC